MNCRKARELISLCQDGELGKEELAELGSHLGSCAKCREEMDFGSAILRNAEIPGPVEPAPYFFARLRPKLATGGRNRILIPMSWRFGFAPAALLALAVLIPLAAGIFIGDTYVADSFADAALSNGSTSVSGLDLFNDLPPDSLGDIYTRAAGGA